MDFVRSAEKSRRKNRRLQNYKLDQLDFVNQEEKLASSRFGSERSSPELEAIPKHWAITSKGFPPGITVDELKKYGRRKQLNHLRPQDNLRLEEGSLKAYKSEYKRRFLPFSLPKEVQENSEEKTNADVDLQSKYKIPFLNYNLERTILRKPPNNLFISKNQPMESLTEKNSKYVPFPHYEKRKLLRRSTALRPEGEIVCETEVRKEYVDYKNPEKAQLIQKLPSLKLEGEFESLTTEQRDKFIAFLLSRRPVLEKKKTSLKMEGDFDFLTEKKSSYIPYEFSERPRIRKRSTSLKLEGEVEFSPEYRNSFVDFPRTRPVTYKPDGKIRHEGEFENLTETKTQFVNFENVPIPPSAKPENNLHIEGEMEISPEYRNNFIDFPRERPFLRRPFNQLKPEGSLQLLTESFEKFSNFEGAEKLNGEQKPPDVNQEKKFNLPSKDEENLKKDAINGEEEPLKENLNSKHVQGEMDITTDKLGFSVLEENTINKRPFGVRQDKEFFSFPEYRNFYLNDQKEKNSKIVEEVKLNSSQIKKYSKEKINSGDNKKSVPETPRRKSSVTTLKEAIVPEKVLTEISKENLTKLEEEKKRETQKQNFRSSELPPPPQPLLSPKKYQAFKVLDVKGQLGCQSMAKDVLEEEKLTSDEENPTYRLEVFNSGEGSPGFYKTNRRVFTNLALDSKMLEEAEMRAKQRAENYVKIVKSPEIPNCLLEDSIDAENRWKAPEKLCSLEAPENVKTPSFVILEDAEAPNPTETLRKSMAKKGWLPKSIDSLLS